MERWKRQSGINTRRTLRLCDDEGAEAVIFDLDTPGGMAWETTTLMMQDLQKLRTRSLSYVNTRALSAGAMTAMSTDVIYMAPASSIGAATGHIRIIPAEQGSPSPVIDLSGVNDCR